MPKLAILPGFIKVVAETPEVELLDDNGDFLMDDDGTTYLTDGD